MANREPARGLGTAFLRYLVEHDQPPCYATGIGPLDMLIRGVHAGQMLVVGGSTGAAKTGIAERIALNIAQRNAPVTFCQLELDLQRQRERFVAKMHGMSVAGLYRDLRHEVDEYADDVRASIDKLDALPLHLVAEERSTPFKAGWNTARACFEAAYRNGSKVLVLDHAREIAGWLDGRTRDGQHAATATAAHISTLTRDSGLAVIVAQQLAFDPIRAKHRPVKDQLMDTRMLAQKADAVVLVHRPFRGLGGKDRVAELIVDKNRNGPEGVVHAHFLPQSIDFAGMTPDESFNAECCVEANKKRARAREESSR